LDIKPSNIIKCHGLENMLIESNQESIKMGEKDQINVVVSEIKNDDWYSDIIYYLKNITCHCHLVDHKRRYLRLKDMNYCLTEDSLGWRNIDGMILKCVNKEEVDKLVVDLHSGYCGYHFVAHTTTHNISRTRYY
jgi:hypothetical protein